MTENDGNGIRNFMEATCMDSVCESHICSF
jgi:hypothetical protein